MKINGYCEDRFISVKQQFEKNFELGLEVGASLAVSLNGKLVVDIWSGFSDSTKTKPWEEDSIVNVLTNRVCS